MQTTLERFWNLHFARFPQEIIQMITDCFPPGSEDLQNLRLTCSSVFHPATSSMFRRITLPKNANAFARAIDVLSNDQIASRIRYLDIPAESFVPRANLRAALSEGELRLTSIETLRYPRLASAFTVRLCRLMSAARLNIRRIQITGFLEIFPLCEEYFITSVVECLAVIELPNLEKIRLDLMNIKAASYLWECYYGGNGTILAKNLLSLKKVSLRNSRGAPLHPKTDLDNFISWGSNLNLSEVTLQLDTDALGISAAIAPYGQVKSLTKLSLWQINITDNFTRVLERLELLSHLHLNFVYIDKDQDRWASVFQACMTFTNIKDIYFDYIKYSDDHEEFQHEDGTFCSPLKADMRAANRLKSMLDDLLKEGKAKRVYWSICTCEDEDHDDE